jgi:adenine-specific DNA-methyltransferase
MSLDTADAVPLALDLNDGYGYIEDPAYLSEQMITYLGNKRALRVHLQAAFCKVRSRLGGRALTTADLFAGSGFVGRLMKRHSQTILANDFELYSTAANQCFLTNREDVDFSFLENVVANLNERAQAGESVNGFIEELYSPKDDGRVQPGERVFYTRDNGRRLDFYARALGALPDPARTLLLGPLLSAASKHANTSGVFKGFYKDTRTGVGKFGGNGADALKRILEPIRLSVPVLSRFSIPFRVTQADTNALIASVPDLDLAYIDPPYNQHPYGSNYFMLNLLVNYQRPDSISTVSGIPTDWQRSGYNVRTVSSSLLFDLIERTPARFLLLSFNAEGFVDPVALREELEGHGKVEEIVIPYATFRGSRNLRQRSLSVNEHLFLLERA